MRPLRDRVLLFVALAGTFALPTASEAQRTLGVKGGSIQANVAFIEQEFGSDARSGLILGGFIGLPVSSRVQVQLEALYTTRGFATTGFLQEGAAARIPSLELPILLKFRLTGQASRVRPWVMAGGFYGFELSCSTEGGIVDIEGSDSCDGRYRNRGTADVGLIVGTQIEFDVGDRLFLQADGRYQHGIRNLNFDPSSEGAKSRAWSVMGGVGIHVG